MTRFTLPALSRAPLFRALVVGLSGRCAGAGRERAAIGAWSAARRGRSASWWRQARRSRAAATGSWRTGG